jgi:hypothetical protein
MWDFSVTTKQVANKNYHCGAADWIDNSSNGEADYSAEDWAVICLAKKEGNLIKKGDRYVKTSGKWEGDFEVFRARVDLDKICNKYELYSE